MNGYREMSAVSLDPPRRTVAPRLRFRVLFGSFPARFGWILLVVGLSGLRAGLLEAKVLRHFDGPLETRVGHVRSVRELRSGKGHSSSGDFEIGFRYLASSGDQESTAGVSFTKDILGLPRVGQEVVVVVPVAHPREGHIRGMRMFQNEHLALTMALPLLAALGLLGFGFVRGRRSLRLLLDSRIAPATLGRHDEPGFLSRKRHRLFFDYDDHRGGARALEVLTSSPRQILRHRPFEIAHDDADPPRALLLASLPGAPRLGDDHVFHDRLDFLGILLSLALPAVGLLGAATGLVRLLFI